MDQNTFFWFRIVMAICITVGIIIYCFIVRRNGLASVQPKKSFWSFLSILKKKDKTEVQKISKTQSVVDATALITEAEVVEPEAPVANAQPELSAQATIIPAQELSIFLEARLRSLEKDVAEQRRLQKECDALREERRLLLEERKLQQKVEALKLKQQKLVAKQEQRGHKQAVKARALRIAQIAKSREKAEALALKAEQKAERAAAKTAKRAQRKLRWAAYRQRLASVSRKIGAGLKKIGHGIWVAISFPFRNGRPNRLGKGAWMTIKVLWAFPVALWRWWCQSNNLRASVIIVVVTVITGWWIWSAMEQFELRKQHPFIKDVVQESKPDGESVLSSGYLPDPLAFYGIQAKPKTANPREDLFAEKANDTPQPVQQPELDSALKLGLRFLVFLPLMWLGTFLYWLFSRREEVLYKIKGWLEDLKQIIVERKEGKVTHGKGDRRIGGRPARVVTAFTPAVAVAAGTAVAVPAEAEKKGKFEGILLKALAAEEIVEYLIKFVSWAIKMKEKKS